ncbi:hypothetical protein FDUTEX481_03360 [Tolypothrix sp. PCC 7601]|nr:hypothetical protein FDUTEX481_03360 [Tolypothrix sp. PCC 7601]
MVCSFPCPMPHSQCPKTPSPCGWSFSLISIYDLSQIPSSHNLEATLQKIL